MNHRGAENSTFKKKSERRTVSDTPLPLGDGQNDTAWLLGEFRRGRR